MVDKTAYYSNARWTKVGKSQDKHNSSHNPHQNLAMARSVCFALRSRWRVGKKPCELRGHCLETWVTDYKGDIVE